MPGSWGSLRAPLARYGGASSPRDPVASPGSEPHRLGPAAPWAFAALEQASVLPRIAIAVADTLVLLLSPATRVVGPFRHRLPPLPFASGSSSTCSALPDSSISRAGFRQPRKLSVNLERRRLAASASWWPSPGAVALAPAGAWPRFLGDERPGGRRQRRDRHCGVGLRPGDPPDLATARRLDSVLRAGSPARRLRRRRVRRGRRHGRHRRILIEIAPQCSGYEGLALVTVFVTLYLWMFRERIAFPRALWLLPAGLVAMWFANVLRIAALVDGGHLDLAPRSRCRASIRRPDGSHSPPSASR